LRDDPLFVYLSGDDPLDRMAASYAAFRDPTPAQEPGFWRRVFGSGNPPAGAAAPPTVWGALVQGYVVGSAAAATPGSCFVDLLPAEAGRAPTGEVGEPGSADRLARVLAELMAHHTRERHWHVGPVGVEPGLQGRGVGAAVMRLLCEAMDAEGEVAFLETEKPENVVFYRRLGFEVVSASDLPGLHTWFMRREPVR
jgi:ribosomal protein S18 acetylase RimI-like enzyme